MASSEDISSTTDVVMTQKRSYAKGNIYGEPPAKKVATSAPPAPPSIRLGVGFNWNLQALANAADAVQTGNKSPVSALNELGVRVNYTVLRQGGPAHCPSFTVSVNVADMTFEGWGHSKREARAAAARACLAALLARAGRVLPPGVNEPMQDFTIDESNTRPADFQCPATMISTPPPNPQPSLIASTTSSTTSPESNSGPNISLFGKSAVPATAKSPINLLYENYPGLTFTCTFGDGSSLQDTTTTAPLQLSHSMRFKVVCQVKDQKFEGYGSSKKLAKLAAARSALAVLDEGRTEQAFVTAPASGFLPQTLADHISKLVNEKFNDIIKGDVVHSKRKVLAGIVITVDNKTEGAKVVAVTTGTKCVSGEHMSVRGRAVNDCHAEVAARRCLQRHLYAQLLEYANSKDPKQTIPESDLEPIPGGGYQLKPDRQVHLYVSTAPCGDGRIFSPHEQPHAEPDKHPNRLARGQLRTKIESGEGTIPVKNCSNVIQTWDGVLQGERLLTMSCSDKVARWCVVGLQGALLSRFVRPVYLHSLVLGSLLHPHHMYRALCGRIESYILMLPPPFRLQRPLLARAASTEARTPARAPSFSVFWTATSPLVAEVVNATTGKLESGQPSLLCKQSMFARWHYLQGKLTECESEESPQIPATLENLLYNEAKQLCPTYQVAKERLIEAFEKAKLGRWVKKPIEQDEFVCEIENADPAALFAWAGCGLTHNTMQVLSVLDTNTKTGNNHANSNKTDGTGDLSHYNFKTDESRLTIDGGDVRDDFRRLDDKALELRMYEQIFGDTADRDGSLNGDGVQKVRAQIEVRNAVQSKDVSMKNYNNKDDVEVDNDEQDTNSQVSFFRWKQKLIKFGTNLFKSYKEIINSKTDSEKTHVPENVRRISNTLKEKYVKQRGAIIDVHHRILKDKRGDNFPNDPINDSPTVDQNELDNVLNIRLSDLISMQQTNKIKPNVNKSHSILTEANPREKCDLSLKDNSNVVESCSNARLKQLLNIKKLMDRNMDSNYKRPVVKKIRVREHETTYDTSGENNSTFNFDDADNSGKKEFRTCVTETEYTYSKVHDSLNSLADDLEKCSILENIEGSKEAYSSIFSKRVYIYKKYSNF